MIQHRPPRSRHGFTLVEMLIATAICSVLLGALFSLLFGALRLRDKTFDAVESGQPRDQVIQVVRRDLMNAVVPAGILAGTFTGEANDDGGTEQDTLTFFATTGIITDSAPWGDIQEIEYTLEEPADGNTDEGYDFQRKLTRNLLPATEEEEEDTSPWILLHHVKSLTIEYWDGSDWTDTWDSTAQENANPSAIRMSLDFYNADDAKKIEAPLEIVTEIAPQPRPTPAAASGATPGGTTGGGTTPPDTGSSSSATGGSL
jgi:prepilin-type N-terminal cleavage/methylation domain-containing protein